MLSKRVILIALLSLTVSGCVFGGKKKCHKPQEYQRAEPGPRVRVPDGMKELDDSVRLPVPYGDTQTEPTPRNEPCLTEPPDFFDRPVQ